MTGIILFGGMFAVYLYVVIELIMNKKDKNNGKD